MTINEILQGMDEETRSWLDYLQRTPHKRKYHISNAGNLCRHVGVRGGKCGHAVIWDTTQLGDRRTRKRAAKVLWDYLASAPSCPPAFVVTMQLPGVIHSVKVNIVLDV